MSDDIQDLIPMIEALTHAGFAVLSPAEWALVMDALKAQPELEKQLAVAQAQLAGAEQVVDVLRGQVVRQAVGEWWTEQAERDQERFACL